jgi:hypothetical protein
VISLLGVCSAKRLQELTDRIPSDNYAWEADPASTGTPFFAFTYLGRYPT